MKRFLNWLALDHRSLGHQPLFWVAIFLPVTLFIVFACISWIGSSPQWNYEGFNHFIDRSKLPLGLLALALPFTALVTSWHRSIQTAKQIEHNDQKESDENQKWIKDIAAHYLEKSFELLEKDRALTIDNRAWINSSNLLLKYKSTKNSINNQTYSDHLQAEEDYWRAKFEILLGCITHDDLELLVDNKVHPAMILIIAEIATWPNQEPDKSQQDNDFLNEFIERLNRIPSLRDFIDANRQEIRAYSNYMLVIQSMEMLSPEQVFEEAVLAGPSDDPVVTKERKRRGLE